MITFSFVTSSQFIASYPLDELRDMYQIFEQNWLQETLKGNDTKALEDQGYEIHLAIKHLQNNKG